jgi:hypothetical protein
MKKDTLISVLLCFGLFGLLAAIHIGAVQKDGFVTGAMAGFTVYHIAQVVNKRIYGDE